MHEAGLGVVDTSLCGIDRRGLWAASLSGNTRFRVIGPACRAALTQSVF
ncbi:hypothetical protein HNQ59_001441 [Chitinivorax tropicus]|uniref:Uncharacterized protein n=1 Tax=Chitinivorax tropicus TaxID=714531 RepID=A0A840MNS5_9PROT|nr:hypothetical protein [Chitinivorax tropicus]